MKSIRYRRGCLCIDDWGIVTLGIVLLVFLFIQSAMHPLSILSHKMSKVQDGDFNQYVEVKGTSEVREVARTYNLMLDDMKEYIDQIMSIEQSRREAEIKALQMQINPHYVYNTLASIKWLIWQKDTEKSIKTIDAFISLLRNTISDTEQFIPVHKEMENLKNYILINNTRYGDRVSVEFFVLPDCENALVPKMILQPFIENAFFHAFPENQTGRIQVFVKNKQGRLLICVEDDGIGIKDADTKNLAKDSKKGDYFSGIGIGNVDQRLKLLYGKDAGITIKSEEKIGTKIIVEIPLEKTESESERKK